MNTELSLSPYYGPNIHFRRSQIIWAFPDQRLIRSSRKVKKGSITIQNHSERPKALTKRDLVYLKIFLRRQLIFQMAVHWALFCDTVKKVAFGTYWKAAHQVCFHSYQALIKLSFEVGYFHNRRVWVKKLMFWTMKGLE